MQGANLPDLAAEVSSVILNVGVASLPTEDTVPRAARWWPEASRAYASEQRLQGRRSEQTSGAEVRSLVSWPARFEAAGLPRPHHAADVTPEGVLSWKAAPVGPGRSGRVRPMKQPSAFQALWTLRGFLLWAGNSVADQDGIWRGKRGDARNRRWFDVPTLDRMYEAAPSERHRPVLEALGWAGLRRNELSLLRVGDVNLSMDRPSIVVTRKGGRRQELPIAKAVADALRPFVIGRAPTGRVYPRSYQRIYDDLETLGSLVGVRATPHDLWRTFGRVLFYEKGIGLNEIRSLYGHASTEQSLYYIGALSDKMRAAVESFDSPRRPLAPTIRGGP